MYMNINNILIFYLIKYNKEVKVAINSNNKSKLSINIKINSIWKVENVTLD